MLISLPLSCSVIAWHCLAGWLFVKQIWRNGASSMDVADNWGENDCRLHGGWKCQIGLGVCSDRIMTRFLEVNYSWRHIRTEIVNISGFASNLFTSAICLIFVACCNFVRGRIMVHRIMNYQVLFGTQYEHILWRMDSSIPPIKMPLSTYFSCSLSNLIALFRSALAYLAGASLDG